jgi:acyl-CoA thioesterase YciA
MTDSVPAPPSAAPAVPVEPTGELCIRTLAMPADTNQNGDIFGGWLLSQMDVGGGIMASKVAKSRTVTVSIETMIFRKPVYVGDVVSVFCSVNRTGRTSVSIRVEAWVRRRNESSAILVTEGNFIYVAIDDDGRPRPVPQPA